MIVTYHPAARAELRRATRWYERRLRGLGAAFLEAIRESEKDLVASPDVGKPIGGAVRRKLVDRFPYGVLAYTSFRSSTACLMGFAAV